MCCRYYFPGKVKLFFSVWSTTGKSVLHLTGFFWESKMESFYKATSKEICFSLCLEKWKLFIQLFWPLSFTTVAKKNTFSVEFLSPWNKTLEKSDVVKHEFWVTSYELLVTRWKQELKFKRAMWNPRITSSNPRIQIQELRIEFYQLRVQIHELRV